jgi:hypothetical protein
VCVCVRDAPRAAALLNLSLSLSAALQYSESYISMTGTTPYHRPGARK